MKTTPENISHHVDGYLVRVQRSGVLFQAFIAGHTPEALARAVAVRDRFLARAGHRAARSNTGIPGVSEHTHWSHNHAYEGFSASYRGRARHFTWRACGGRAQALRAAVAYRSRLTGERYTRQQVQEALSHV